MSAQNLYPICSSDTEANQPAFISPWVRDLGSLKARCSRYRVRVSCKADLFDFRFTNSEMIGIRGRYRDPHYLALRQSLEPSYMAGLDDSLGNDLSVLRHRHSLVQGAIAEGKPELSEKTITTVDVDGDRGQSIPSEVPSRLIRDVSNKQTAPGMSQVADVRSARRQMVGRSASKLMPLRQSEHINFFSEDGLRSLAYDAKPEILLLDKVDIPSSLLKDGRLQFSRTLRLLVKRTAA